jgi:tetratricopeptide (TPR) repeat protein
MFLSGSGISSRAAACARSSSKFTSALTMPPSASPGTFLALTKTGSVEGALPGIAPGQPEFAEARNALEKAASERSNYPSAQIALGKVYLLENRLGDAVVHLEMARQLDPNNAAVYSRLADAYRRQGAFQQAQDALATLVRLNQAQADKIRYAPGDRKVSYGGHEERPQ